METQTREVAGGYAENQSVANPPFSIFSFFHFLIFPFSHFSIFIPPCNGNCRLSLAGRGVHRTRAFTLPHSHSPTLSSPIRPFSVFVQDVDVTQVARELAIVEPVADDKEVRDAKAHVVERQIRLCSSGLMEQGSDPK